MHSSPIYLVSQHKINFKFLSRFLEVAPQALRSLKFAILMTLPPHRQLIPPHSDAVNSDFVFSVRARN